MKVDNVLEAIGRTPLVKLNKILAHDGVARIYVKAEFMNPGGSIKDRAALSMIEEGMRNGVIDGDTVIVEPTSGNTGIGLAMVGAVYGMKVIFTMPENMSQERIKILRAYGAEVVLTPRESGMTGAIERAREIVEEQGNAFMPSQFENGDNARAHYLTTAPEIFEELPTASAVVAGIGTGGTVTGIGEFIRDNELDAKVYGVEPAGSPVLTEGRAGAHGIQGIGAGFVPEILNRGVIAGVLTATEGEAFTYARRLAREEGILAGISAGASLAKAVELSKTVEGDIVVILPDTGMRYLSTELYE